MSVTIHFETLGCRLNQDETEGAARVFALNGFNVDLESVTARTAPDENVLLCVINTCTVTSKAEQKARRIIRLLLEKYSRSVVLVTGCYAELDRTEITSINPDRISILPGTKKFILAAIAQAMGDSSFYDDSINVSSGRFSLTSLNSFIERSLAENNRNMAHFETVRNPAGNGIPGNASKLDSFTLYTPVFEKHSRASIKIQDGCNNECAFCRIHLARGKSISLDVDTVVARVRELESQGACEVVFTGVNLSQYRGEMADGSFTDFNGLLKVLISCTERIKFRVSSFYPQHVTDELCMTLSSPRVQPFFHLSIQSGSNKILRDMRRPYNRDQVKEAVERLRKAKVDPFISCDIIAGFPGETDEDFKLTEDLCNLCSFSWIHAFPFSPRPGTPAYSMKPQIPERIKDERVKWLTEKAVQGKTEYIQRHQGKELWAIVEKSRLLRLNENPQDEDGIRKIHAVTENFLHVEMEDSSGKAFPQGTQVRVRIDEVLKENILCGKEIECRGTLIE